MKRPRPEVYNTMMKGEEKKEDTVCLASDLLTIHAVN